MRLSWPLEARTNKAYDRLLTQHAIPNGTHCPIADTVRRYSACTHDGKCPVAIEIEMGIEGWDLAALPSATGVKDVSNNDSHNKTLAGSLV